MNDRIAADFETAVKLARRVKRTRPELTEKVRGLLHALTDPDHFHLQPILADALEEDGLATAADLEPLRSDPTRRRYLHEHPTGYRVFPDPKLTISEIRRRNAAAGLHFFSPSTMRFHNSRIEPEVHQGPFGTFFVHSGDNFDGTSREWKVTKFLSDTGETRAYVAANGNDTDYSPNNHQFFQDHPTPSREAAHQLAAHLAEHGRLPTASEEHERLMGMQE